MKEEEERRARQFKTQNFAVHNRISHERRIEEFIRGGNSRQIERLNEELSHPGNKGRAQLKNSFEWGKMWLFS
jgi:hypothetical protein